MPTRSIDIDGARWNVFPSGYTTQYDADEFGLLFVTGTAGERVVRITRYSPRGARSREQSLAELTDAEVRALFAQSQASSTSPEAGYAP
jgi:hypothetical protein